MTKKNTLNSENAQTGSGKKRQSAFGRLPLRAAMLLVGTACAALGIALTTVSGLGTTPISSVPWTLSAATGLSFGTTTFLVNAVFFLLQAALLRRSMPPGNILQLPCVLVFGLFIDAAMACVRPLAPQGWMSGLVMSLIGNAWLAAGIFLQVRSKTLVQPGEGAVLAVSVVTRRAFGTVKIAFDCTLVLSAVLGGLALLGRVEGVREGTLISAILVGTFIKILAGLFPLKQKN